MTDLPGRVLAVAVLLAAASAAVVLLRRRAGEFRAAAATSSLAAAAGSLGTAATFVQFSSKVCASCPQVRRALQRVTAGRPDVALVELDVDDHMDLVRELGILRTPTVFVLDRNGRVRARTSGQVRPEQALAVLEER